MVELRFKHGDIGGNMGLVSATVGSDTDNTTVSSYRQALDITGLPRITGGQFETDTLALDETGLTGIVSRQWRIKAGANLGTSATQALTGQSGQVECVVTCDQGTLTTPSVLVYTSMGMASHDADDAALLALVPHEDATHIAIADGAFGASSTWLNGRVPGWGARVLVPHGINVTYDRQTVGIRMDWVRVDGTLTTSLIVSTHMLCETLVITRMASHIVGTVLNPIPQGIDAVFEISNRDYRIDSTQPGDINLTRDPNLLGRGILSQGTRSYWGAAKTPWLRVADGSTVSAGATSVILESVPSNWQVGDTIAIGGTSVTTATETEYREITSISSATVSWSGGLTFRHDHRNPNVTRTDLQPGVANITRNIKIRSETGSGPAHQQGHTMDMHHHCRQDLWYVEHTDMGRTIKELRANQAGNRSEVGKVVTPGVGGVFGYTDWSGSPTYTEEELTASSNIKSRYPVHSHLVGFNKAIRDVVHGCTVRNPPGWGITHHGCEVEQNSNVVVDYAGAGMATETGDEIGEWLNNFTAGSKEKDTESLKNGEDSHGNFGITGCGMFFRGRMIRANNNFNMDATHGIGYYHREATGPVSELITKFVSPEPENMDLRDLFGYSKHVGADIADYPIIHANNNESAGCFKSGMSVVKNSGRQDHHWNVKISNFKAWCFGGVGQHVQYVHQYLLEDSDVVAHTDGQGLGVEVGNNAYNIAIVRPKTEGLDRGVYLRTTTEGTGTPFDASFNINSNPRYIVVAQTAARNTSDVAYADGNTATVTNIMASEPTYLDEPSHNLPFKIAEWDGATSSDTGMSAAATGQLTDSFTGGTAPLPFLNEFGPLTNNSGDTPGSNDTGSRVRSYSQDVQGGEGYWTISSVPYVIFPGYFGDRLTGNPTKSWFGIEMTGNLTGYSNNGVYSQPASAPVVSAANINVPVSGSATIDILALATHPNSATMRLSNSYSQPDLARLVITGGSVEVFPDDTTIAGQTDRAWLWVEDIAGDGNGKQVGGNATQVSLNITYT